VKVQETEVMSDKIITVPNIISFIRLLGVPLFLWLIIEEYDEWALVVLVVSSLTDWLDGAIARATGQITRLGQLLDPIADRAYIAAALIGLAIREIIPWWLVVLLVLRDVILAVVMWVLKRYGVVGLPVHFLGKAATFCLLYAFPMLLLGEIDWSLDTLSKVIGWAFVLWGTALYWYAGGLYVVQARQVIAARSAAPAPTARD